jgi:hypothetical protein
MPSNAFPFPYTTTTNINGSISNYLPYISFGANGQLTCGQDQFIALTAGSMFVQLDASTGLPAINASTSSPDLVETPPGNTTNNAHLIHIDWVTARAKVERNQF